MFTQENINKKILILKKNGNKIKKNNTSGFQEYFEIIKKEMFFLFQRKELAKEIKFLRKMAINIKQLQHDSKIAKNDKELNKHACAVEHFLSTPLGAPFISQITLAKAADTFSEQNPLESDLSELLSEFAKYGQHYATQLLRVFLLYQNNLKNREFDKEAFQNFDSSSCFGITQKIKK